VEVMSRVKARSLRLGEAAELLELSYRQGKRIWARYRDGGAKALQHGNCGRESNRAYAAKFRTAVLEQVKARYADFGPTLAAEHLASDDGLEVQAETLRRWMKEAGLWRRQRRRKPYRQRREAKAHFGELVQLDGSFHEWLEKRGPQGCFMNMADDATAKALGRFSEQETTWAAGVLRRWIERYGVPLALYTDWKNVYVRPPNAGERMRGEEAVTQFGRMCAKLDIRILAASSPQAKGRVDRAHGTHQDRLVKKLRLAGIANYDEANAYLEEHYLAEHNRRYARPAAAEADYHRRRPTARQLDEVFWLEEERVVSGDWVVSYKNRWLQLERKSRHWAPAKSRVLVRENESGEVAIHYRGQRLLYRELKAASKALSEGRGVGPYPPPPPPHRAATFLPLRITPGEKASPPNHTPAFWGQRETTTRGHFYCGQDGDISNVV
jgi:transposase